VKKILGIIILGLLLSGNAYATLIKKFNISIGCNFTGFYLNHLDRSKDDFFKGFVSDTDYYGKKGPDFNLMISLEDKSVGDYPDKDKWQGEIIYLDHKGKKTYKLKGLDFGSNGTNIDFSIVAVRKNADMNNLEVLRIGEWNTTESKENYYKVTKTYVKNIKEAFSKEDGELDEDQNYNHFKISSDTYVCLK
tara:strand:+ start:115 stop:690 length:576 start_codon:yes stop_codon:yes gene_type:complete